MLYFVSAHEYERSNVITWNWVNHFYGLLFQCLGCMQVFLELVLSL